MNPILRYVQVTITSCPPMLYCNAITYNNLEIIFTIMNFIIVVVEYVTGYSQQEAITDQFYSKEMKDFLDLRKLQ